MLEWPDSEHAGQLAGCASYHIVPLGKAHKVVSRGTLGEAGDPEPARLAVFAVTRVAGDRVANDVAAVAGGLNLWGVGKVANDGDLGQRSSSGGAESTGRESRCDGGTTEDGRERHDVFGVWWCVFFPSLFFVSFRRWLEGEREKLKRRQKSNWDFDSSRVVSKR